MAGCACMRVVIPHLGARAGSRGSRRGGLAAPGRLCVAPNVARLRGPCRRGYSCALVPSRRRSCGAGPLAGVFRHGIGLERRLALLPVGAAAPSFRCGPKPPVRACCFVLTAGGSVSGPVTSLRVSLVPMGAKASISMAVSLSPAVAGRSNHERLRPVRSVPRSPCRVRGQACVRPVAGGYGVLAVYLVAVRGLVCGPRCLPRWTYSSARLR